MTDDDTWVRVAQVTRPHGIRGALRLHLDNPDSELMVSGLPLRLSQKNKVREHVVRRVFAGGDRIELEGLDSRNDAETLRGATVEVRRDDFPEPSDDETYLIDLIGAEVRLVSGDVVGKIVGFGDNGAQPLAEIKLAASRRGKVVEFPFLPPLVVDIDEAAGVIVVDPPEGLLHGDADVAGSAADAAKPSEKKATEKKATAKKATEKKAES